MTAAARPYEAPGERWYVLWTYANEERSVFKALEDLGITASIPKQSHMLIEKGRKITRERIVFTGYCFARLTPSQLRDPRAILEIEGIGGFLCDGISPAPIPYSQLSPHIYDNILSFLKVYDRASFKSNRALRREKARNKYLANANYAR